MSVLEIVLLICGAAIFIVSFFLPSRQASESVDIDVDELNRAVDERIESAKRQVNEIVDETSRYAVEKTEIALDRLANEKIMAVDEYSQTVLSQIDKNHQEVVFLFDMLNEKSVDLKNTVREAQQLEKETKDSIKEQQKAAVVTPKQPAPEPEPLPLPVPEQQAAEEFTPLSPVEVMVQDSVAADLTEKVRAQRRKKETKAARTNKNAAKIDMALNEAKTPGKNKNEMILHLHRMGKSNVEVARELGLGMGEVKLVIDLFEGA